MRGSFSTFLGLRPSCFSRACNFAKRDSGVSPARGTMPITALIKDGEPDGQSTGAVSHNDDFCSGTSESFCSSSMALSTFLSASPRLEPRAMKTKPPPDDGFLLLLAPDSWLLAPGFISTPAHPACRTALVSA